MALENLTYAVVGGPPDDWQGLEIIDLDTGRTVDKVIEVDAAKGWLVRYKTDPSGAYCLDGDEAARERVLGRFEIRRTGHGASDH